jgi:hypothetical protein
MFTPGIKHAFMPMSAPNPTVTRFTSKSVRIIGSFNGTPV